MEKKKKTLFDYKDPLSLYPFIDGAKSFQQETQV